jgi:hypothetical protein
MQLLKSKHAIKKEFSFGLKFTDLTFKLTHITFNHGAFEHLNHKQFKDRTIKSSTKSQAPYSTIVLEFL